MVRRIGMAGIAVISLLGVSEVAAQDITRDLERGSASDLITFERWCADIAKLTEERCGQKLKPDYDEFVVYRETIERYEGEFSRQKRDTRELRERLETQDTLLPGTYPQ
ncbi:MAG: hypothetical protein HXY22_13570 [Alphaproteobacteria bacterium]|nr:hypothetical protein [Alphaproteobacteria bacterium]